MLELVRRLSHAKDHFVLFFVASCHSLANRWCHDTIMKTCLCNVYPVAIEPHFYIAKLGYAGVYMYLFFLFLLQNIDCGYL